MMKGIFRYLVALVMVPVGGALGVLGVIQNRWRKERYSRLFPQVMRDLRGDEDPDGR